MYKNEHINTSGNFIEDFYATSGAIEDPPHGVRAVDISSDQSETDATSNGWRIRPVWAKVPVGVLCRLMDLIKVAIGPTSS
jgi:hypothetical protein